MALCTGASAECSLGWVAATTGRDLLLHLWALCFPEEVALKQRPFPLHLWPSLGPESSGKCCLPCQVTGRGLGSQEEVLKCWRLLPSDSTIPQIAPRTGVWLGVASLCTGWQSTTLIWSSLGGNISKTHSRSLVLKQHFCSTSHWQTPQQPCWGLGVHWCHLRLCWRRSPPRCVLHLWELGLCRWSRGSAGKVGTMAPVSSGHSSPLALFL